MKTWILIHSSGFPASQWKRLAPLLAGEVIAPNLPGYGGTHWDPSMGILEGDTDFVMEIAKRHPGAQLVGHSFGGLVALHSAAKAPDLFDHLWLIEPIVIGLVANIRQIDPVMMNAVTTLSDAIETKQYEPGIRSFFDYWGGDGAFDRMAPPIRAGILSISERLAYEIRATSNDQTRPEDIVGVPPTTILVSEGRRDFVQAIANALVTALPDANIVTVPGEHMAPVTHPKGVAAALQAV